MRKPKCLYTKYYSPDQFLKYHIQLFILFWILHIVATFECIFLTQTIKVLNFVKVPI